MWNRLSKMLRSVSCSKQLLVLETFARVDAGNCRNLLPQMTSSNLLCRSDLQLPGCRSFHTNFCHQRQFRQKVSETHKTLVETKEKPFSDLTVGEKGEFVQPAH